MKSSMLEPMISSTASPVCSSMVPCSSMIFVPTGDEKNSIADAVAGDGAAIDAVSLAELCVGEADPPTVADRARGWGVEILDVPAAAAEVCARA
jgi:hypothetical protein